MTWQLGKVIFSESISRTISIVRHIKKHCICDNLWIHIGFEADLIFGLFNLKIGQLTILFRIRQNWKADGQEISNMAFLNRTLGKNIIE